MIPSSDPYILKPHRLYVGPGWAAHTGIGPHVGPIYARYVPHIYMDPINLCQVITFAHAQYMGSSIGLTWVAHLPASALYGTF